jgi:5'-3' exonuclease
MYKFLTQLNLVKEHHNLTKYVNTQKNLYGKKTVVIGIDFLLYAHKFMYSYGNMVVGFWNQIVRLLSHRIIPLYVYDGKPPQEKQNVLLQRQRKKAHIEDRINTLTDLIDNNNSDTDVNELEKQKNKLKKSLLNIRKQDIDVVTDFFDALHIPYINATGEADALCAKLFKDGHIAACLSEDMDMLVLGCGQIIKLQDGKVFECNLKDILKTLDITYEQFVELALLFGCDYIKPPFRVDNNELYSLIKTYNSIENILNNANHENINSDNEKFKYFIDNYRNVKHILLNSSSHEEIPDNLDCSIRIELNSFEILRYLKTYGDITYVNEHMQQILDSIEYVNFNISKGHFIVYSTSY